jgi:ATP-binding cassette subfamily B multidrug efflux pump
VDFTYPDTGITALKGINLQIKAGEKIAIVGKTGSGKSTLVQLLLRLYDCTSGKLSIDGRAINDFDLYQLRSQVSYVPQDGFLFSERIDNNIAFGLETSDKDEVEKAARLAVVHHDIEIFRLDMKQW